MARIKIEELAQKYGVTPKELLRKLKKSGWSVNTLFALVDENKVAELFRYKDEAQSSRVIIKKYENRRFYSNSASKHVTLEEIKNLIKEGVDLEVVDAVTDQDITSEVMAQILLEEGRFRFLPTQMLRDMIRFEDQALMHFLERYFSVGLELYNQSQKEMGRLYQSFLPGDGWMSTLKNPFLNDKMTAAMSQWLTPFASRKEPSGSSARHNEQSGSSAVGREQSDSPAENSDPSNAGHREKEKTAESMSDELQALRRQLEALQSQMSAQAHPLVNQQVSPKKISKKAPTQKAERKKRSTKEPR